MNSTRCFLKADRLEVVLEHTVVTAFLITAKSIYAEVSKAGLLPPQIIRDIQSGAGQAIPTRGQFGQRAGWPKSLPTKPPVNRLMWICCIASMVLDNLFTVDPLKRRPGGKSGNAPGKLYSSDRSHQSFPILHRQEYSGYPLMRYDIISG